MFVMLRTKILSIALELKNSELYMLVTNCSRRYLLPPLEKKETKEKKKLRKKNKIK